MTQQHTFLWHDYETFGADPTRDRPCQFAALRTDAQLEPIGEPVTWFAQPADDYLPAPEACLITGITPQRALAEGEPEALFMQRVLQLMSEPGTCVVGYNSLSFDDEVTRFSAWRNLFDPYAREWQNGNSRFDLINVVRMAKALRPEGINWPENEQGRSSFRLEHLTAANGIEHSAAHDAMADVNATLALARLLRSAQPKLFDWALKLRDKRFVQAQLTPCFTTAFLHFGAEYGAERNCTALLVPLAIHPQQKGCIVCFDLNAEPDTLLAESSDRLLELMYLPEAQLGANGKRPGLVQLKCNRVPMLAPVAILKTLPVARVAELLPQLDAMRRRMKVLQANRALVEQKVAEIYRKERGQALCSEAESSLYNGGFLSSDDRQKLDGFRDGLFALASGGEPVTAASTDLNRLKFSDERLADLCLRFKARNFSEMLTEAEHARWSNYRLQRLQHGADNRTLTLETYFQALEALAVQHKMDAGKIEILEELKIYGEALVDEIEPEY
ncbi:exodeoxyribonuclease I [Allohahella sp. A8]|uniref:exodeoxyribonuclease I n=1 Tax=Allohahella sp. A8 TaxID=3141461 RepID=UPI003A801607